MSVPLVALFAHIGGLGKGSGAEVLGVHRARPRSQVKVWAKVAGKCLPRFPFETLRQRKGLDIVYFPHCVSSGDNTDLPQTLLGFATFPAFAPGAEVRELVAKERDAWTRIAREANIRAD